MLLIFLVFLRHLWPSRLWNAQNCWSKCEPMFHHNSSHCHIQDGLIELISLQWLKWSWQRTPLRSGQWFWDLLHVDAPWPCRFRTCTSLSSTRSPLGCQWRPMVWCTGQSSMAVNCHGSSYLIMAPASWQTRALFEAAWPGQCSRPMLRLCDFCQKYGQSESWITRPIYIYVTYVTRKCSQSFIINHNCTSIAYILITWKCVF